MKLRTADLTLAALFVALMAIGANITNWIPALVFGKVPLTLQTFFCILGGILLGSRLGAISMTVYALVGLAGAPVFAKFSGGFDVLVGPTFGFILSFILAAYAAGKIVELSERPTMLTYTVAAFAGLLVNYVIGTSYLYVALSTWMGVKGVTYFGTWKGMLPFLPKDTFLTILTAILAPRIHKAVSKSRPAATSKKAA
ncbi:biotin transporter BioY [Fictibacillus iocasae]|uniref:Biotin transporter n=1 Tax=Fictibacillus iocasae TaxID=2715437 RepID=A0ABW2NPI8_9BACL